MAQGPWRCSQCGTINEPVANSCRTCGKWPSLFDLEDNVVDDAELMERDEPEVAVATTFEPAPVEAPLPYEPPPSYEPPAARPVPEHMEAEPEVFDVDEEAQQPRRGWASAIIPIAVLLYFVISAIAER